MNGFFSKLEEEVKNATEELSEFQKKFKESPAYALSWADSVFSAAVVSLLGKEVLKWDRAMTNEELKESISKRLISKASSMSKSTSPSANLIKDMELEFWGNLADKLNWYPHKPEIKKAK